MMLDKDYNLKIVDFGFSAPANGWDGSNYLNTKVGTEPYMAPELW
jgi:serine/threonine protein kinase